ncbi:hypothetical protein SDRG_06400 [Saprolegnia diclina VS20]|uniref:Uncharacterized protein n=1 Tax=Saprolegnia diclina (strain VS20) TaxID=1156394 RepID=T0QQV5_SAPDV|nr:hypothetical protein SDRG_06400 [Saprolegnia diclina VS20]EQC36295.1 hypothetical protein SDRG_06400 [Saprolegnia diclina VS20]|eukprot:XP_008610401.1 hypothetical protein SDRG_06400 [Saprolegnia diclina VS20]
MSASQDTGAGRAVRFAFTDEIINPEGAEGRSHQDEEENQAPPSGNAPPESGNGLLGLKVRNFGPFVIAQKYELMDGTGSAVWQAAEAMLQIMTMPQYQGMLHNRKVLELGAGTGVNALAAAMWSGHVVATDGDLDSVSLIEENVKQNQLHLPRPITVRHLEWGNQAQIKGLKHEFGLFDVILGSDVLFNAIEGPLLVTVYELCGVHGIVILTHTPRETARENAILQSFTRYFNMTQSMVTGTNVICTILSRKVTTYY